MSKILPVDVPKTRQIPVWWRFVLCLEVLIWIPLAFIGFDSHHDGLILTSVHQFREALHSNSDWPFNQYGPSWLLIFGGLTWFVPNTWVFLVLRMITILSYLLTAFLVWKTALRLSGARTSFLTLLLFFFTQPFVTDFGSDLVPWPSSLVMPLIAGIVLIHVDVLSKPDQDFRANVKMFLAGILIALVFFCRIQVGLSTLIVSLAALLISRKFKLSLTFFLGFISITVVMMLFLAANGWLADALSDQFIFGSVYLRGDKSSYPLPIFTIVGTLIFLAIFRLTAEVPKAIKLISRYRSLLLFSAISLTGVFTFSIQYLNSRGLGIIDVTTVVTRRFWICYYLAVLIYSIFSQFALTFLERKNLGHVGVKLAVRNVLLLLSLASQIQIFPLFDQMHFWWGSVPGVVLVVLFTLEKFGPLINEESRQRTVLAVLIVVAVLSNALPMISQLSEARVQFPTEISRQLYVPESQAVAERKLQNFFEKEIPSGSRILNLCENANVFFADRSYSSATRVFVFWVNMPNDSLIMREVNDSEPNVVVTCSMNRVSELQGESERVQQKVLNNVLSTEKSNVSYRADPNQVWTIWKSTIEED